SVSDQFVHRAPPGGYGDGRGPGVGPRPPRVSRSAVDQEQPSAGGASVGGCSPCVLPNHLSSSCLAVPSLSVFWLAWLTASQVLTSPFFRPAPSFSAVNGSPRILKLPPPCLAKPARMRSSVVTASRLLPASLATHSE